MKYDCIFIHTKYISKILCPANNRHINCIKIFAVQYENIANAAGY